MRFPWGNKEAIAALVELIKPTNSENIRWEAAYSLGKIDPGNKEAIAALVELFKTTNSQDIRRQAANSLEKIGQGNKEAIAALVELVKTTNSQDIRRQAANSLEKIGQGNKEAIAVLVQLIEDRDIRSQAVWNLKKTIATEEQQRYVVSALGGQLGNETYENNFYVFGECHRIFWDIAQDLPYPEFYRAWHGLDENKTSPINLA